jgi:hypothetical protein
MFRRTAIQLAAVVIFSICSFLVRPDTRSFADDIYPKFRKGMWQLDDTMEINGKPIKHPTKRCTDPTTTVQATLEPKTAFGCVTEPPKRTGNRYQSLTKCSGAMVGSTERVITVESDSAYTDISVQQLGKIKARETLIARRIGDCH